jgi:peptide-methionine (S)-S-oxide reductase
MALGGALPASAQHEKAAFGAGSFWGMEAFFAQQPGVIDVVTGYAGGRDSSPTHEMVSNGQTGHAEVVQVTYDPAITSFEKLIEFFWTTHDPTDAKGAWPDFGRQYRSIILASDARQLAIAEKARTAHAEKLGKPVATEVTLLLKFHKAEEAHQDYVRKHPNHTYVRSVVIPKMEKLGLKTP